MWKLKLIILGGILLVSQFCVGQEQAKLKTAADTIPFALTNHNNISIKAILNKTDTVDLMFHTAANSVTLIKSFTDKLTNIKWTDQDSVKSWGGQGTARYSEKNFLQIAEFEWGDVGIWENEHSGPTTDGKFGPNLFENKIIEINFGQKWMIIHNDLPQKAVAFEQLQLDFENGFMFVEGSSTVGEKNYTNRFLIHSGYGGTILYDDQFVVANKIGEKLEIIDEKELKDAYGNVLKTKKATLPSFNFGQEALTNIPVGFFEGSIGRQRMSVIGGDLLKRFDLIIDSKGGHLYLKSNGLKDLPYSNI